MKFIHTNDNNIRNIILKSICRIKEEKNLITNAKYAIDLLNAYITEQNRLASEWKKEDDELQIIKEKRRSKLDPFKEDILYMRKKGLSTGFIARNYNVSDGCIRCFLKNNR